MSKTKRGHHHTKSSGASKPGFMKHGKCKPIKPQRLGQGVKWVDQAANTQAAQETTKAERNEKNREEIVKAVFTPLKKKGD